MKHNPKLHERVAALPGHARLHPLQHPRRAQGALRLMWELQSALAEIAGLPHVSLQPSAGSHGELAGVLLTRAYHADRGEPRTKVLTPDTAHGTNPATVTMAGYEVVKVGTNDQGGVDVEDLKAKAGDDVACLMLTNPNTLGLFDPAIEEIAHVVHDMGATLYYDGANLNAVMGYARPGDMGFDIVHFNLHKTFTQPHGGGGPGAGPIAVSDRIEPYLPEPAGRPARVRQRRRPGVRPRRRPPEVDRPPARVPGQLRRLRALLRLHPLARRRRAAGGVRDRGAERELPDGAARRDGRGAPPARVRADLHARVRAHRRADEEGARDPHARPRQAAARLRLPPADRLLPAAGRRGAADRADRDRDARDPRRVRRRDRRDPRRGRRGSGDRAERAATRRRCGGSTRPAPRSARSSASRCSQEPREPLALGRDRGLVARVDRRERPDLDAPVREPPASRPRSRRRAAPARRRSAADSRRRGSARGRRGRGSRCRTPAGSGPARASPGRAAGVPGTSNSSRPCSSRKRRSRGAIRANSSAAPVMPDQARKSAGVAGPNAAR